VVAMTWATMTTESATGHWAGLLLFNEVLLRGVKITNERQHSCLNEDNKDIMPPLNTPLVVSLRVFAGCVCNRPMLGSCLV